MFVTNRTFRPAIASADELSCFADHHEDLIDGTAQQLVHDSGDHRLPPEGQQELLRAHPARLPGGKNHCGDHGVPTLRESRGDVPLRRTAINCATMLAAISGTVTEPISRPIGA